MAEYSFTSGGSKSWQEPPLNSGDLKVICKELFEGRAKWRWIGLELNLTQGTIDAIEQRNQDPGDRLYRVLSEWLNKGSATWRKLVDALYSAPVGEMGLSKHLEQKYCPEKIREKRSREHDDKKQQLDNDIMAMERKFSQLQLSTRDSLKKRCVSYDKLVDFLMAYQCIRSVMTIENSLLLQKQQALENANSIDRIFRIVSPFWSFIDYELLREIIVSKDLGADSDRRSLVDYITSLHEFLNSWKVQPRKISCHDSRSLGSQMKLCFKLDTDSLSKYRNVKAAIARILEVKVYELQLYSIEDGCVELMFMCHNQKLQFPLSQKKTEELLKITPAVLSVRQVSGVDEVLFQEEEPEVSVPRPMAVRVHVPLKKAVASVSGSPAEKQIISKELDKVISDFTISLDDLKDIEQRMTADFEKGLAREGDDVMVKMYCTYIHSLPNGSEEGDFLVLDLKGTNFKIYHIKLRREGQLEPVDKEFVVDQEISTEKLFDHMAQCLFEFIQEHGIREKLPLAFIFSLPIIQHSLTSGTLTRCTNYFKSLEGAVGEDVVKLLEDALFVRRKDIDVEVVALLKDTACTLLAMSFVDDNCQVGLILGTGTNACYMEQLSAVGKYTGDRSKYSQVVINCEWGAFGDDGSLDPWRNKYDKRMAELEDQSEEGQQLFEKMICRVYLGELVRQALLSLIADGVLFGGRTSEKLDKEFKSFVSDYMSLIETGDSVDLATCKKVFRDEFFIEASDEDCEIVRRVCASVSKRAARLAAAGVVALVKKINKLDGCTVAVDGSLYRKHPTIKYVMKTAMEELAPGNRITMRDSEEGTGKAAAVAAAMSLC